MGLRDLNILLIEDDTLWRTLLKDNLSPFGKVTAVENEIEGEKAMKAEKFDIAFIDLDLNGPLAVLELIKTAKSIGLYSVCISSHEEKEVILDAYKFGCMDYLSKDLNEEALDLIFKKYKSTQLNASIMENLYKDFKTKSKLLRSELEIIPSLVLSERPVLLTGPTGVGKTVLARFIHSTYSNKSDNFVEINCAQFNEGTIESELFGHKKGAFTGAIEDKIGKIALANGGTLFLDEIHSLSMNAQKKLLKVLEEKTFTRLGCNKVQTSNFRIIAATCENLLELVALKKFRHDLFARVSTFKIDIPALYNRKEDIALLLEFFLSKSSRKVIIEDSALGLLEKYNWPNNIREIEDLVENWLVKGYGVISPNLLDSRFQKKVSTIEITQTQRDLVKELGLQQYIEQFKIKLVQEEISNNRHKQLKDIAKELGISASLVSVLNKQAGIHAH